MTPNVLEYHQPSANRPLLTWFYVRPVIILASILIPLDCVCAYLSYYTVGEVASLGGFVMLTIANLVAFAMFLASRKLAMIALILIGILFTPHESYLGLKWLRAHLESNRIIEYTERHHSTAGNYPKDLNAYEPRDPWIAISYRVSEDGKTFELIYSIGSPHTAHTYSSDRGWFYYPD